MDEAGVDVDVNDKGEMGDDAAEDEDEDEDEDVRDEEMALFCGDTKTIEQRSDEVGGIL